MKFSSEKGIQTGRWLPNELLLDEDINFVGQASYINLTNQLVSLLGTDIDEAKDYVIGGLELTHSTLLTMVLNAGIVVSFSGYYLDNSGSWGFVVSAGKSFSVHVGNNQSIAVSSGGAQDRIDIVEVRPTKDDFDSELRQFKNPATGVVGPSPTNTKTEYGYEFAVREGTEAATPVADVHTVGWIKIAEVYVAASVTSIAQKDINGVDRSVLWTTETEGTKLKDHDPGMDTTFLELATVPKISIGSTIEANGLIHRVTSLETPTGSAVNGAYLFFDSDSMSFVWSTTPGTYDATRSGVYDTSNRRQCRFRLTSGTTWVQISKVAFSDTFGIDSFFATTGVRLVVNRIDGSSLVTENVIFDTLSPFLPNTGDEMGIHGGIRDSGLNGIIVAWVERYSATVMRFHGIYGDNGGPITMDVTDGVATTRAAMLWW